MRFRGSGDPVLYLSNPDGMSREVRRGLLDDLAKLNEQHYAEFADPEIATRIAQYEMAYKMQASVPELTDFSNETAETLAMYGPDVKRQGSLRLQLPDGAAARRARRALRAVLSRRLGSSPQPHHAVQDPVPRHRSADAPRWSRISSSAACSTTRWSSGAANLAARRSCRATSTTRKNWGRDHHPYAFTIWMAGGGIKPGISYGETDEFGFNVVQDPVHVHDFQATVLHLLGIDHERLTYPLPRPAIPPHGCARQSGAGDPGVGGDAPSSALTFFQFACHISGAVQDARNAQRLRAELEDDQIPGPHCVKPHHGVSTQIGASMSMPGCLASSAQVCMKSLSRRSAAEGLSSATNFQMSHRSERASSLRTNPLIPQPAELATAPSALPSTHRPQQVREHDQPGPSRPA